MRGLDEETLDAIREIVNIGVGRAAGQLQEMTGSHIRLRIPDISLLPVGEIRKLEDTYFKANILSAVQLDFKGTFSGVSVVIFPQESAAALVMLLTGENENSPEMDAIRIEALKEVGNIMGRHDRGQEHPVPGTRKCQYARGNTKRGSSYRGEFGPGHDQPRR